MLVTTAPRSFGLALTLAALVPLARAQDVQIQSIDGRLVTGVGDVDESMGMNNNNAQTLGITIGQRVFSRTLQPNFIGINPGFNIEPASSPIVPAGVGDVGEDNSVFLEFAPFTLDDVTSSVFFWDGADANADGQLTFDDIELAPLNSTQSFAVQDVNGDAFFFDDTSTEVQQAGLIETTTITEQLGADIVPGGRLHQHLFFIALSNGGITADQQAGLFVASLQVRAEGFETSDPFFFVLQSTLESPDPTELPIVQFEDEANLLTAFIEDVLAELPGDFNDDGSVDAADYTVWRDGFGTDFTLDDYQVWLDNFGSTSPAEPAASVPLAASIGPAVSVPEPSCLLMTATLIAATASRRRLPIR